jgi:hypothetical protein
MRCTSIREPVGAPQWHVPYTQVKNWCYTFTMRNLISSDAMVTRSFVANADVKLHMLVGSFVQF